MLEPPGSGSSGTGSPPISSGGVGGRGGGGGGRANAGGDGGSCDQDLNWMDHVVQDAKRNFPGELGRCAEVRDCEWRKSCENAGKMSVYV